MQIEKALISDGLRVSKAFCITIIYNFAVIYPLTLPFSLKVAYFLTVSIAVSVYKQNFAARTAIGMRCKIRVFVICLEAIIYLLLYNLHNYIFN